MSVINQARAIELKNLAFFLSKVTTTKAKLTKFYTPQLDFANSYIREQLLGEFSGAKLSHI